MAIQSGPVILGQTVWPDRIAPQRIVADRITPIVEMAKEKRVLNIGCCGSDALVSTLTVHRRIASAASYIVGIDIYEAGIEKMKSDRENAFVANAETFDLDDKNFEIVVLGDVIEHVSNPGLVLDNANRRLNDDGIIVVSTPTPFSLSLTLRIIRSGSYDCNNEHVSWFDPVMLTYLLARSEFEPKEVFWTDESNRAAVNFLQRRRFSFCGTFGIVAKKLKEVGPRKTVQRIQTKLP
jgi:2-polyprenyl-3-methyl-5-hydroxy-6-metoxy-1,4-benzoquinol methylase